MERPLLFLGITFLFLQCQAPQKQSSDQLDTTQETGITIAFGSCSHQDSTAQMWKEIIADQPDFWLWGGDNIYGDTDDMTLLQEKYNKQKSHADYQQLIASTPIMGIWDDHDYGVNDGGKEFAKKDSSKALMLEFLSIDKDNPVWEREGTYQSYIQSKHGIDIQFILLDTRYFRDQLTKDPSGKKRYIANNNGDILGEAQWLWLEEKLKDQSVDINIIMSSIQVIPEEHGWEKWATLPQSRNRFFKLLETIQPKPVLILSGDRHIAEVSKIDLAKLNYPLYEFTSSGLTHTWRTPSEEANQYREGKLIIEKNYGLVHLHKNENNIKVELEVKGKQDTTFQVLTYQMPL
ncbi:alkaline phosphatase D family protein [Limibacter armeniacum]|uniref:alkaline phosphatase D family protein n=1 Tax=Limibacter armeniacum TaxID=466084 RepID=UPI002FE60113